MRRPHVYTLHRSHGHAAPVLLSQSSGKATRRPSPATAPTTVAAPATAEGAAHPDAPASAPSTPATAPTPASPTPGDAPVRWWSGGESRAAMALPPHPHLWEWWCGVFREHGYNSASVGYLRRGVPPEVLAAGPAEYVTPQPGQARLHRAWTLGWGDVYPPIAEVLHAERAAAHASEMATARERQERTISEAQEAELARQVQARKAAADAAAREAQLLAVSRSAAILAGASVAKTADALRVLIERSLPTWTAEGQVVSLAEATKYLQHLATAGSRLASLGEALARTERMPSSDPVALVGATVSASPRSRDEAVETLRMVSAVMGANDAGAPPLPPGLHPSVGADGVLYADGEGAFDGDALPEGADPDAGGDGAAEGTPTLNAAPGLDAYALAVEADAARTLGAAQEAAAPREGPPEVLPVLDAPTATRPTPQAPPVRTAPDAPAQPGARRPSWASGTGGGGMFG